MIDAMSEPAGRTATHSTGRAPRRISGITGAVARVARSTRRTAGARAQADSGARSQGTARAGIPRARNAWARTPSRAIGRWPLAAALLLLLPAAARAQDTTGHSHEGELAREAAAVAREAATAAREALREVSRAMTEMPADSEPDDRADRDGALPNADSTFRWDAPLRAGGRFTLYTINGPVAVTSSPDGAAHVRAVKRWRRGNPADVRVEVVRSGEDVVVCALWSPRSRCTADGVRGGGHTDNNEDNDVRVDFTVQLPAGVRSDLNTVNGNVLVTGVSAPVSAETVNGRIEAASVRGPVVAETVNGSIVARMDSLAADGDLSYETVNGAITVELPANASAEVSLSTVNGSVSSDFPLTVQGRISPRRLQATLGAGGRRLRAETVNGSVRLVRRGG